MGSTRNAASMAALAAIGFLLATPVAMAQYMSVTLSGAHEVPPVSTAATGTASVTVYPDHAVSARVVATGMNATASHIHDGAMGANGPVIVPFIKIDDNTFAAPAGSKLTDAQYADYLAGKLYVNVHSAAHPGGEIRAQLAK